MVSKRSFILIFALRKSNWSLPQTKKKRQKVKSILFQSPGHKKRTQSSQSKGHVNHFLRPPGCHIFSRSLFFIQLFLFHFLSLLSCTIIFECSASFLHLRWKLESFQRDIFVCFWKLRKFPTETGVFAGNIR